MKKKTANKSGQEEMIGFAVIVIIVAVLILIFIRFSMNSDRKEPVESYEVESFINSLLQYTSDCEDYLGRLSVQQLIIRCYNKDKCTDGKDACRVLEKNIQGIISESWKTGEGNLIKGYSLNITSDETEIFSLKKGNFTNNYKSSLQSLGRDGLKVIFTSYY